MQGEMEWPQLFATSRRMNPMTLATGMHLDITWISLGYHLDITWICCSAKTRERHQRALPALPGRERESSVCVCVKPANRHAGKSLQIEVSGQFYMFTRGAGCPCQYQPNEEACM